MDIGRIASALVLVSGVVVLFSTLLDLYSIEVSPGAVEDSVNGTVDVGIGFYTVVPFNAPVIALAVPVLLLVAGLTALPGLLGRAQGTLVSAVSAIAGTLLGLVLMMSDPLPAVELTGDLEREAGEELDRIGISSVDELVESVVDIGPGTGLILAVVFGVVGSAAAVFAYLRSGPVGAPTGAPPPMTGGFAPTPQQWSQMPPGPMSGPMPGPAGPR